MVLPVKMTRTNVNIREAATGQVDDCTTDCLLGYLYFKENYKLTAIDLIKCNADPEVIQQIDFFINLEHAGRIQQQCSSLSTKSK